MIDLDASELAIIVNELSDEQLAVLWRVIREEMWERKHLDWIDYNSRPKCQTCGQQHPREQGCGN